MNFQIFRIFAVFCLGTCLGRAALAAPNDGSPGREGMHRGHGMRRAMGQLNLTEAQKTRIMAIVNGTRPQYESIDRNTSLTPAQRDAKMMALKRAMHKKTMAVLTPAQRKKYESMMQRMRAERRAEEIREAT